MPIYEYRCSSCGHSFDVRQGFSDDPSTACLKCQGAAKRVLQPVGIVFKGSGWHSTDYRSNRSGSSTGDTSESSSSESKPESKSETKSETKTESKSETKSEPSTASTGSSQSSHPKG